MRMLVSVVGGLRMVRVGSAGAWDVFLSPCVSGSLKLQKGSCQRHPWVNGDESLLATVPCHIIHGAQHSPWTTLVALWAFPLPFHLLSLCCRSWATIDWLKYWAPHSGPVLLGAEMCHAYFHCQCPAQCGSCAASRQLPELGSWNGCKNPRPAAEGTFSLELRYQKSSFQLGCCVHWMSLTVGKMRRNYYFEVSCRVMIDKSCSSQGNLLRSQQVPLLHSAVMEKN